MDLAKPLGDDLTEAQQIEAVAEVLAMLPTRKTPNTMVDTYAIKHSFEHWCGYLSVDTFEAACRVAGVELTPSPSRMLRYWTNLSTRAIRQLGDWRRGESVPLLPPQAA